MNLKTAEYSATAPALPTDEILTPSETAIAAGFASGLTGKEIADLNNVTQATVIRHTQNIYDKTGITRATNALAVWFIAKNFGLDLSEIRRRAGAALLLGLVVFQMATTDFDSQFMRTRTTRTTAARTARTRRNREDSNTFKL